MDAVLVSDCEPIADHVYPEGWSKAKAIGSPMYWGRCTCGRKEQCLRYTAKGQCRDKQVLVMRKRQDYRSTNGNGRTRRELDGVTV